MKTLFISAAAAVLLLGACSSSKNAEVQNPAPQISIEEAFAQCKQSTGENGDRAVFDACMKDKGFQRKEGPAPVGAPPAPEAAPADEAAKAAEQVPAKAAAKAVKAAKAAK